MKTLALLLALPLVACESDGPIERAAEEIERSAAGVGLGVYVSRLVLEAHGGTIRASSPGLGGGSQFVVRVQLLDR